MSWVGSAIAFGIIALFGAILFRMGWDRVAQKYGGQRSRQSPLPVNVPSPPFAPPRVARARGRPTSTTTVERESPSLAHEVEAPLEDATATESTSTTPMPTAMEDQLPRFHVEGTHAQETCGICLEQFGDAVVTAGDCLHKFHYVCIVSWLARNKSCPTCRKQFLLGAAERHGVVATAAVR